MVVTLHIKLYNRADGERVVLKLRQEAIFMQEEVSSKAIGVNESPTVLKGTDVTAHPKSQAVSGARHHAGCDLFGNCAASIIEGHVKLDGLVRM